MKTKIIIVVKGGCVQEVYASDDSFEIDVLDYDNDDDRSIEVNNDLEKEIQDTKMKQIY